MVFLQKLLQQPWQLVDSNNKVNVLNVRRGCLDIAAMSVVMNQAQVRQQASLSVMKSAMSTAESNGSALIEMLNSSSVSQASHPSLGGQIDVKG